MWPTANRNNPRDDDLISMPNHADQASLEKALSAIWTRRLPKSEAQGIHGTLFYEHERKNAYYPTRRDDEAANPDGSRLR